MGEERVVKEAQREPIKKGFGDSNKLKPSPPSQQGGGTASNNTNKGK